MTGVLVSGMLAARSLASQSAAPPQSGARTPPGATAFVAALVHVGVVPMDRERVLRDQTVVIRGDRIIALGPSARVPVPTRAVRVDGTGKYLIPGLADMHTHVNGTQALLPLFLANGVTTVRDMYGTPELWALRSRVARGELLGPRIYAAVLDQNCPGDQELAACLAAMKAEGAVMVKIYSDSRPRFDSVVAIARQLQLPVGGHVSPYVGLGAALAVPYATIEHLYGYFEFLAETSPSLLSDSYDSTAWQALTDTARWMQPGWRPDSWKLRGVAVATRRAGSWNAPTLVITMERACWVDLSRRASAMLGSQVLLIKALHDAGAGLLLSTDIPTGGGMNVRAGFAVHRELELLVMAGLTPYQALATGTRNVAQYLGTADSTGTVAAGKRADLVLLAGNPLADIRYTAGPVGVMLGGRWLSRAELDAGLDSLASTYSDQGAELARLRRAAALHRGIRMFLPPRDTTPLPAAPPGALGNFCDRVRSTAR